MLSLLGAFIVAAALCTALVNYHQRQQAINEARDKALILLEQNLALHTHFRDQIRVKTSEILKGSSPDAFDPVLMSSFYTIRKVNENYNKNSHLTYYYKVCAINARHPKSEADAYEAEIIRVFNDPRKLPNHTAIRDIDSAPYYVVMRPGARVQESCMQCHSTPEAAPKELVSRYGMEKGFGWRRGEIVSAYSIRIPLSDAFAAAQKFSIEMSLIFFCILVVLFASMTWLGNSLIFKPLNLIRAKAAEITDSSEKHLGEEIPMPRGVELRELTSSFNSMSQSLRRERDLLENRVRERTANLQAATEALEAEILERKRIIVELQEAFSQIKTLKGLLPICAHCKKIRDDEGYWQSVEKYLHDRSEVEFSHGICPDCLQEHFPEFSDNK